MSEMSLIQESLKVRLDKLECHFTWDIKTDDLHVKNLLSRLEEQDKLDLGKEKGAARAQCSLGFVKFLLGHEEEALTHTMRSEKLIKENLGDNCDKTLIVTYGNFAWINYHMKKHTECDSYLKKLQKISEKIPTEVSSIPEVLGEKGWAYLKFSHKYYDKAAEAFKKAVELDPENSELNTGYAITLYRIETYCEENSKFFTLDSPAIKQLRKAIDINPDDGVLQVLLGLKFQTCSKVLMNESEKLVETALNGSPEHPHVMRYVAMFLRDKGSVDWSIALLKKALERSPNSCFIHHQLAMCYKKIKLQKRSKVEVDEARNKGIYYLENAISLNASFIVAMNDLALLYGERRELCKAEELFDKTFKTAKEKNEHLQSVHFYYAEFQQYSNRCEDLAIQHYKECLTMGPQTSYGTRSAKKLMNIAQKHLKVKPFDWKANEILGLIYQMKGELFQSYANISDDEENDDFLSNLLELVSL